MRIFITTLIFSLGIFSFAQAASVVPPVDVSIEAVVGAPAPVILNTPTNVTAHDLDLTWSQNLNGDFLQYEVYYSTTPVVNTLDTLAVVITNSATLTYHLTGLTSNQVYYFVVVVRNSLSLISLSNEVTTTTSGGGGNNNILPPAPTLDLQLSDCPVFSSPFNLTGQKSSEIIEVLVNNDPADSYPTLFLWEKLVNLILGMNPMEIIGRNSQNISSNPTNASVERCEIGDVNCNTAVNDYDLSGLAWHWALDWCWADFNRDDIVNDFDLAGLAGHWN